MMITKDDKKLFSIYDLKPNDLVFFDGVYFLSAITQMHFTVFSWDEDFSHCMTPVQVINQNDPLIFIRELTKNQLWEFYEVLTSSGVAVMHVGNYDVNFTINESAA